MTTEDDFQRQLDAHPEDYQTRLVFADWLEERGDARAEGYRALGTSARVPRHRAGLWEWSAGPFRHSGNWWRMADHHETPHVWSVALITSYEPEPPLKEPSPVTANGILLAYLTRRAAEDAAAIAFSRLPEPRRAELLGLAGAVAVR